MKRPPSGDERGQATVELALVLPVVVMFVLAVVQVAVVARSQLAVELAAREAARAASVSADPVGAANAAARRAVTLEPLDVTVAAGGDTVGVTVRYVESTDVAFIGLALGDITVSAHAVMTWEPP